MTSATPRSAGRRGATRTLLFVIAAAHLLAGTMMLVAPAWFYDTAIGVAERGPYNAHFLVDLGAMYVALALLAGWAAVTMSRDLIGPACSCIVLVAGAHLAFHAAHLHDLGAVAAVLELSALTVMVLLPAVVVVLHRNSSERLTPP